MLGVLEKISGHRKKLESQNRSGYERLVHATDAGETIDPAEAVGIMDAAGKSDAHLANDVSLLKKARDLDVLIGQLPALEIAHAKILAEKDAANKKLTAAKAEHLATCARLDTNLALSNTQVAAAQIACDERVRLPRIATNPETRETERKLTREAQNIRREIERIERDLAAKDTNSPGTTLLRLDKEIAKLAPLEHLDGARQSKVKKLREQRAELQRNVIEPMRKSLAELLTRREENSRLQRENDQAARLS
jgi:hypothetical protein